MERARESFTRMREGARACEGGRVSTFLLAGTTEYVDESNRLWQARRFKAESKQRTLVEIGIGLMM